MRNQSEECCVWERPLPRARLVCALVDLRVRITQLDRDVPLEFVFEPNGLDTGNRLDHRGLAVRDVADRTFLGKGGGTRGLGCDKK